MAFRLGMLGWSGLGFGISQGVPGGLLRAAAPQVAVSPTLAVPASTLTVDGGDFPAGTDVKIFLDKASATPISASLVDADGFFDPNVTVPAVISVGAHTLIAVDGTTRVSTLVTVV